jgi:hypothetical protein
MEIKDPICEQSVKRLFDARERGCEYSFLRYLDDLRERLEILDEPKLWSNYGKYLNETF